MPTETAPARHRTNPFTTRSTRPGALPPLDAGGNARNLGALLSGLEGMPAAAIVGPHGTGKSTLLVAVEAGLATVGRSAGFLRLRRRRDAILVLRAILAARPGSVLSIDGWERLGRPLAGALLWTGRIRGCRIVVTSHRPAGIPTLVRTIGTLPLLGAIVARLPDHGGLIGPPDLAEVFARHGGNIRDALGDLYDRFERRARRS